MLILGVDPGTAITGYGLVRGDALGPYTLLECGVIRTHPGDSLSARLSEIHRGICEIIARHQPAALAVEDIFYGKNVRTTVTLGHARGVILLAGQQAGLPIHEFPPASVKKSIVGAGAATKEQVQFMVARLLRLKAAPAPSDAADGVAVAICGLMQSSPLARRIAEPRPTRRPASR
ncbi:MAG: crossover junction endodeoxyribonuclease RuvC [Gemmatimonadaceae bacterium]